MAEGPSRGVGLVVAAVVAAAIVVAVWAWGDEGEVTPRGVEDAAAVDGGRHAAATGPAVAEGDSVVRTEIERTAPGVVGTLVDGAGRPLAGWSVVLQHSERDVLSGQKRNTAKQAVTGPGGDFVFEALAPDHYEVLLVLDQRLRESFRLGPGERRAVSLRLPDDCVPVEGRLTKDGVLEKGHSITVLVQHGPEVHAGPDKNGVIRCLLPPGTHRLRVEYGGGLAVGAPRGIFLSEHLLTVHASMQPWQFEVGGTTLELVVDDGASDPIPAVSIAVQGRAAIDDVEVKFVLNARARRSTFESLPPGQWTIAADSPWLARVQAQQFSCGIADRHALVTLTAVSACTVKLSLRAHDGRLLAPPLAVLPALAAANGERPCLDLNQLLADAKPRGVAPGYTSVALGRAELHARDREVDGMMQFLPFDPLLPESVDVTAGSRNEVTLLVEPRALVDLRPCDRSGREDPFARIQVFADQQPVHSHAAAVQRWLSFLPPGGYRVVVDRQGRLTEEVLAVGRENVLRRLRP